jgi:hypothetical protein
MLCKATSQRPYPLKRINHASDPSVRVLRRASSVQPSTSSFSKRVVSVDTQNDIRHDDTLLFSFTISPSSLHEDAPPARDVTLILRPTPDFIHPEARINYHSADGSVKTVPLRREDVLAFSGHVLAPHHVEAYWAEETAGVVRSSDSDPLPWARVTLHDKEAFQWEGAFVLDGEVHTIKTEENYLRAREDGDPDLVVPPALLRKRRGGGMVVLRDSDVHASDIKRDLGSTPMSCAYDSLPFNSQPDNIVLAAGRERDFWSKFGRKPTFLDTFIEGFGWASHVNYDPLRTLSKRQSTGDVAGGMNLVCIESFLQPLYSALTLGASAQTSNFANSIGSKTGCPAESRVVFLGLAADCTYVTKYQTQDAARTQLLQNLNSASALYSSTFNIGLGAVELNVVDPTCPTTVDQTMPWNQDCDSGPDLNTRLSLFSQWRGNKGSDGAGLWHLLTNCPSGSEVGVAWLGQLCRTDASGSPGQVSSGTGVTASTRSEWQVMAHEMGHKYVM